MDYYTPAHWHHVYDQPAPPAGTARRWLCEIVMTAVREAIPAGGTLLDIACGDGFLISAAPDDIKAIGADFSAPALRLADSAAPGRAWLQADATCLPLADESVDVAVCVCALWAITDPPSTLAELRRVLRPGGTTVMHIWSRPQDCRLITLGAAALARATAAMLLPASAIGPFDLTPELLQGWVTAAGFESIRWQRHQIDVAIADIGQYWIELSGVAQTAHTHYRALLPQQRQNVDDALWNHISAIQSQPSQSISLPLACQIMFARRP